MRYISLLILHWQSKSLGQACLQWLGKVGSSLRKGKQMLVNCNTIYQRNLPQSSQIEFITASSISPPEFLYASIITEGVITVYMALVP